MEQPTPKVEHTAHELAYGKFLNRLIVDYKDIIIINTGSAEELP